MEKALPYLAEGKKVRPAEALKAGLIHELADSPEEMLEKARAWILANPAAKQPWDSAGYKIPGGTPASPNVAQMLAIAPSVLRDKTKGCFPAPEKIMCAAVEGAQVDFDTAQLIEARYFTELTTGQVAKNMIGTFWFQLNEINAGKSRPQGYPVRATKKVGVLGAGMMGAGIAYVSAAAGIEVVLKDVSLEAAEKGKAYSARLLDKKVARGHLSAEKRDAFLARIVPSVSEADFEGCDLIIEAVFEDRALKGKVTAEAEKHALADAVVASIPRPCRSPVWPRRWRGRRSSSACTSSARWTRCRWWRSSVAKRPATKPWHAVSTTCCRSRKRRSWSTTAAASSPRGYSAPSPTKASPCSAKA